MAQSTARDDLNRATPQVNFATPELLDKVRFVESSNQHIDPTTKRLTRSPTGAEGAYQILPSTQKKPGFGVKPVGDRTEAEHRRFAGDYLNALSRKYGDDAKAVVAYNQGPGTVDRAVREAKAAGTTWYAALEKKEGRDYLVKVLGAGAIPTLAVAQAPAPALTPDLSKPVTVNPSMRAQVERMREQRASAAAPSAAPVDSVSALTPIQQFGVDNVGAGFQAALGFSMLGASGRGLPTDEDEAGEETAALTAALTAEPTAKQALSSLRGLPTFNAFAANQPKPGEAEPVQMADGGSLDDLGDDVGVVKYTPVGESTNDMPVAPQIKLRRPSASKPMGSMGSMSSKPKKEKEDETPKGTARQQLEELQYKTGLTTIAIKDKLRGLGADTFGAPTLSSSRGKLARGPLSVASFDKGGDAKKDAKKDPVSEAEGMLATFKKYGEKARDFMVENMISPTDIASGFMGVKKGTALGLLTYSGGLNEGEDAEVAKMREAARQQQQPQHFAWGGQAAAFGEYYNPTTKSYANTPPMIDNPDYTTKTYYEQDPSGSYVVSKDPFKAAGPVYSHTAAVAGTPAVKIIRQPDMPGTPGTPESYNAVAKPAATWNQAKVVDPNSGYTRTTPGTNASSTPPADRGPVLVPTNFSDIAAPVVRNNPYDQYAMPFSVANPSVSDSPYAMSTVPAKPSAPSNNPYAMSTTPVARFNGSPETGETGAAYGNPTVLAQGDKMRARRALEQVTRVEEQRKDDALTRGRMERYAPVASPYASDTSGPRTLDEAAGLDPKVDRSTFLPYSKKEGLHVPAVAADLLKLAKASDPRYSHLMQPDDAVPLSANLLGGGFGASMATKAAGPGTLGMFIGPSSRMWRKKAIEQAEKMEAEGRTPEEIWSSTFSARAPWDNQWRQRISDISMNMTGEKIPHENPLAVVGNRALAPFVDAYNDVKTGSFDSARKNKDRPKLGPKDVPLTEQVSWPRLQNAYPGLLESMVIRSDREIPPWSGYLQIPIRPEDFKKPTQSTIGMGSDYYEPAGLFASRLKPGEGPWDPKSSLAHEVMHRIQEREGFGSGSEPVRSASSNPDAYVAARYQKQLEAPAPSSTDRFLEKHRFLKSVLPATKREKALRRADSDAAHEVYERVGGEAEARLVQAEKNMSQDALDNQYPYNPKYFKEQTGVDISTVLKRAGGSPEEGERSVGDRLKGYGETAASLLSGLGASIPAGYSGLVELARTRDPEKAAEEIGRRQAAMTYEPRTASGKRSTESAAALLENLNIPAQYVGDKAFEATGDSPLAGAAAQTLLDPLNFIPGAKGLGKLGKKGIQKAIENASMPSDPYFAGAFGRQRGAVKPYGGTFARNSPEFSERSERKNSDYVSNLERYNQKAREQVKDSGGQFETTTPEQKQAMLDFYNDKAMPYFEERHGTLKDPVFESLVEGRITLSSGADSPSGFRDYLIKASKRRTAPQSRIRYPADPKAYEDLTQKYDTATGLRPTGYYPSEQNLLETAIKNSADLQKRLETSHNPSEKITGHEAEMAERTRVTDFIQKQLEKQKEALPPELQNQNLNPPGWHQMGMTVQKENIKPSKVDQLIFSDLSTKLSGGLAPFQPKRTSIADLERYGALLNELKQRGASTTDPLEIKSLIQQTDEARKQITSDLANEKKLPAYNVSDKMLEAMTFNEPIWDIGAGASTTTGQLNFLSSENLNSYMRTLSPEKIKETPFDKMVEEASKYNAYALDMQQLVNDIAGGKSVNPEVFSRGMSEPVKTYENGFRWVKANDETALTLNGASVGHCLKAGAANCSLSGEAGGTGRRSFDSGDTEIYFLQDKRGVPVTTVEVINAKDPTKRKISQTKGNGTKSGDTAPVHYDSMVYDLATQLNPVKIIEREKYLSPSMKQLQKTLNTPPPELPFKKGGVVSAARLLKEMPRTQPEVTGVNRLVDWVAQRLPANKFPTSARTLLETVQGKRDPITESYFSPAELDVMRQLITQKGGNTGDVQYADYVKLQKQLQKQGGGLAMSITPSLLSMGDPIGNVQTTLGRFQYARDAKGNLVIQDTYDFNPHEGVSQEQYSEAGPYGLIRGYASEKIPPGSGRTVNINLGK